MEKGVSLIYYFLVEFHYFSLKFEVLIAAFLPSLTTSFGASLVSFWYLGFSIFSPVDKVQKWVILHLSLVFCLLVEVILFPCQQER